MMTLLKKIIPASAPKNQIVSPLHMTRILIVILFLVALLGGYYHALYQNEVKRTQRLERRNQLLQQENTRLQTKP